MLIRIGFSALAIAAVLTVRASAQSRMFGDGTCAAAAETLLEELRTPFADPNDPGLHERRVRLRGLFNGLQPSCAREMRELLGDDPGIERLSVLFHSELATSTRHELLEILDRRAASSNTEPATGDDDLPSEHQPLPAKDLPRYENAFSALRLALTDDVPPLAERRREECWLEKLARVDVDDRVIWWETICPRESMASSPFVTSCDLAFRNVSEQDLHAEIEGLDDVERVNDRLRFVQHVRSAIVFNHELGAAPARNFRLAIRQASKTVDTLDKMANAMGLGGASAMPRYYRALAGWLGERQGDVRSVLSCF